MIARCAFATFCALLVGVTLAAAQTVQLAPYKDRQFALPKVLESRDGGAYRRVDYREGRDVNGRDEIPGRKVRSRYVSLRPRRQEADLTLAMPFGTVPYSIAGRPKGASVVSIYVHGRGGDRRQGMNDRSFGGNFNRLKNLMVRNGGLHIAADMPEDPARGAEVVKALMREHGGAANVVVACGSQGAQVCYNLLSDGQARRSLAGVALLGAPASRALGSAIASGRPVPIFIGHGSRDTVYGVRDLEAMYRGLRENGHPVRMVVFESGIHGTPIRMTDWRETINWMLRGGRG